MKQGQLDISYFSSKYDVDTTQERGMMENLKRRYSIEKAEWSDERENQYKQDCLDIVFSFGDKLRTQNDTVYIMKNGKEVEIEKPVKPKTFWYETWLKLRTLYEID